MDNIEKIIELAKLSAATEEQKRRAGTASIVYKTTRIQQLQDQVSTLQGFLNLGCIADDNQASFIRNSIHEAMDEINQLQGSLNVECTEQLYDLLKQAMGNT